jgi:hypothetical protein
MDSPGQVFSPVSISSDAEIPAKNDSELDVEKEGASAEEDVDGTAVDPLFADPQEDIIQMGVEEPKADSTTKDDPTAQVVDSESATGSLEASSEAQAVQKAVTVQTPVPSLATFRPATVKDGWRPTLIGTLMEGPTPRAVLAMPNGDERVIHAGDMLSEDGVVVMAIGTNYVELAIIRSAEGRAQIENLTLSTQF